MVLTLLWLDDFESYTVGVGIPAPWSGPTNANVSNTVVQSGAKSLALGVGGNPSTTYRAFGSNPVGVQILFGLYIPTSGGAYVNCGWAISDAALPGSPVEFCLSDAAGASSPGTIRLVIGGVTIATASVTPDAWHVMEANLVCHAVSGSVELKADGVTLFTYTGDTTVPGGGGASSWNLITLIGKLQGPSPAAEWYIDNLSIYEATVDPQAMVMVMA